MNRLSRELNFLTSDGYVKGGRYRTLERSCLGVETATVELAESTVHSSIEYQIDGMLAFYIINKLRYIDSILFNLVYR